MGGGGFQAQKLKKTPGRIGLNIREIRDEIYQCYGLYNPNVV